MDGAIGAGLTGLQRMQAVLARGADGAAIGKTLNFKLTEIEFGRAVFVGDPGPESLNPLGVIHGGWSLTVIDSACGCATMSVLDPGLSYTTVETKVNMTRAIKPNSGEYRCEGVVVVQGRQIITTEARLYGPDGKLYAHGTSTCMVLKPRE